MCRELYQYLDQMMKVYVPRRTRHRQCLAPWITSHTSNLLKQLKTEKALLERKPTSYRKQQVHKLKNLVTDLSEEYRKEYQEKLLSTRNTDAIFKHLKCLNKSPSLPKIMISCNISSTNLNEQVDMLNEIFQSVFTLKQKFSITDVKSENPILSNFFLSKRTIQKIVDRIDVIKSRGPNGVPPAFFQKTFREISKNFKTLFKNIERLRKIPDSWKTAAVTPAHQKEDKRIVGNYRPVSLLNIESKIFEKCIYIALYNHFTFYLTKHQHGFVKHRSVLSNMLSFLRKIHEAPDSDPNSEIVAFYTDFSKTSDKVPQYELIQKVAQIGVGWRLLEILINYLENRNQFVRIDNCSSRTLDVFSGVPQGSLLGPLLFCIFINDLSEVLTFSEPFIFADGLKVLSIKKSYWEIQDDLDRVEEWVRKNGMELAMEKCTKITFRGSDRSFNILDQKLDNSKSLKDLGIHVSENLTWKMHIEERLRKANKVLYLLRRNVAVKLQTLVKLGLYKSLFLPVLLYGFACVIASRADLHSLENFQKKVVRWITANKTMSYRSQLKILNILRLPMFLQLNDVLLLSKITNEEMGTSISLRERPEIRRRSEIFKLWKTRTEKGRSEFFFRNCRLVNRLYVYIDFMNQRTEEQTSKINVEICWWRILRIKRVHLAALMRLPHVPQQVDIILKWRRALSPAAKAANSQQQ